MKRSTKVALTLFLPAVASFGCDSAKKPTFAKPTNCSTPAKPGEPPKETVCEPIPGNTTANQSNHNTVTHHRPSVFPWFWMWGWGSSRSGINAAPNSPAATTNRTSGLGASQMNSGATASSGLSANTGSSANTGRVSSGGFGRTGGAMSASS